MSTQQIDSDSAKLSDFTQRRPAQLNMFGIFDDGKKPPKNYSNLIELYDALPKYFHGKPERIEGKFLETVEREFFHRGKIYKLSIFPAKIKSKDGVYRDHFPSGREEIIEDALRKFMIEGQSAYLKDSKGTELASVFFSLYQLRLELKARGHHFNINEIKDAIFICGRTIIEIRDENGNNIFGSAMFPTVGLRTKDEVKIKEEKDAKCFVRFHPLVTQSINALSFRQVNYHKIMAYKRSLARWFHKRLSHYFIQASESTPYTIKLSTILRDSGTKQYSKISNNIRDIKMALEEMMKLKVLSRYSVDLIYEKDRKRKIADAKFNLHVSSDFEYEMISANRRQKMIEFEKNFG